MAGFLSLLRAFLWLRWRSLANLVRVGGRRSTASRLSAWSEVVVLALLGLAAAFAAVGLTVAALFAGPALVEAGKARPILLMVVRGGLLMLFFGLVFFSVFQAYRGAGGEAPRLRLLPIPEGRLHFLEMAAAAVDPWIVAVAPGMLVLALVVSVLRPAGALPLLLAALLLLAILAVAAACVSQAAQLVLRDRRRTAAVTLVALIAWMVLSMLPVILGVDSDDDEAPPPARSEAQTAGEGAAGGAEAAYGAGGDEGEQGEADAAGPADGGGPVEAGEAGEPAATPGGASRTVEIEVVPGESFHPLGLVLPSEAFAFALAAASAPPESDLVAADAWLGTAALALLLALLYLLSRLLWHRLLAHPGSTSGKRGAAAAPLPALTLPGLGPGATAVAWSHLRNVLRSVQGKLALAGPVVTVLVLGLLFRAELVQEVPEGGWLLPAVFALGAVAIALLSQQGVMLNQLAADGSGLTLGLLSPLAERDLLRGKAAAGFCLLVLALVPALAVAAVMSRQAAPLLWLAALLAGLGGAALSVPLAAWASITMPKAVDLDKMGKEGQAHQGAVLLGMLSLGLLLTPALAVGALALLAWESLVLLVVLEVVVAAACGVLGLALLRAAEGPLARRREALFLAVADRG